MCVANIDDPPKIKSNLFVLSLLLNYMSNPLSYGHVPRTTGSRGVAVQMAKVLLLDCDPRGSISAVD